MIKRPNPNEDDDELLRQQEEFFRKKAENKSKPGAVIASERKDLAKPSTSISNLTNDAAPDIDIQEQIANTFEAIPTDIKLKDILENKSEPKKLCNLRFDNSSGFPKAVRRDPDIKVGKGSIFSQHIKRLKKEEPECRQNINATQMDIDNFALVVNEKFSEKKIISNFTKKTQKFTKLCSTTLSSTDQKQIDKENTNTLTSMSEAEILAERDKLIATMDPAIVAFLRSERRKKEKEKLEETRNLTIQEQNEAAENIKVEELVTPAEVMSRPDAENWLNFNRIETNKLAWMKNVEIPKKASKEQTFEARFDFDGYLLPFSEENITEKTRVLYHHGDEAGRPGYNLQEILQLSRSNVIQQKIIALNTLGNILALNATGIYDNIIDIPIEQIFFVLRFCLDDNTPGVLNAAVKAMRNLIYFQLDEICLDNLLSFGFGGIQPILAIDNSLEDDNTINDQQLVESNLVKCLARTDILIRIRYIINTVRPPLETLVYCIEILTRLARDSEFLINRIFKCEGLITSLVVHFLPHPSNMKFDQNHSGYNMPLVQAVKFFRILCSRSQTIAAKLIKSYNLLEIIIFYLYEDTFSQNASGMKLQIESFHFWSVFIHYGMAFNTIRSHESLLLKMLTYHFQHTDNLETTTLVRQSHVSALLLLISQISKKGTVLSKDLKEVFIHCADKWIKQFKSFGSYTCGKSQIISAVLVCSTVFLNQQEKQKIDYLLEELLKSKEFDLATKYIINGSLLLNDFETHKSSANIKSLESAAWFTMEHIIPLMQSNSSLPFVYCLSCAVLSTHSRNVKKLFLENKNIQSYLRNLQKSDSYFHIGNWFTRCESLTIINILKIAKSIEKSINPTLFYDIAVKCLCVFAAEQKNDMEYLMENIIFCKEFYPIEVIFENTKIDVQWNNELGTSWNQLDDIKKIYTNVLGLKNNILNLETSLSLDISMGNVIPVDWSYTPIIILYSNQQANKQSLSENEQIEIIKNCLSWILIYETHFPSLAASISPTEKYCRLACLFLGSDNLFLVEEIQNLLKRNFEIIMKFEKDFNFKKEIAGLTNFQDFYTQLLEQYQAVSYGNKLFGNVILVPLAQRHNVQYRKTLWSEYRGVTQVFNVTASEMWCTMDSFKTPPEEDISLLQSYRTALITNSVQKQSVLNEIARHHLEEHRKVLAAKKVEKESSRMEEGLIKLSHAQRKTLAVIFIVLNVTQVLLGTAISGSSVYVCVSISPLVYSEKAEINFVFMVYGIFGVNIICNWLIGIKICQKCIKQAHKKSTRSMLLLWYCAGTNTVITLIIIANMTRKTNRHIMKSMKNSIQIGMKNYLTDVKWKQAIDQLQYNLECCGFDSYEDWHYAEWLNKNYINEKSELVKDLRLNSDSLRLPVVPFSCCKLSFPMQCLHDPVQQEEYTHMWVDEPQIVTDSLNTEGCVEKLKRPIGWVFTGLSMVVASITFFHVLLVIISRILYTSCRNAILLYDPKGTAPGWIFGRGDCGYSRGKTLTEIMGITNEILERRILADKMQKKDQKGSKSEHSETSKSSKASTFFKKCKRTKNQKKDKDVEKKSDTEISENEALLGSTSEN